ncbi:MAG: acetyl-CoA acetyltransferase, partial [Mycobacterium sp.]|uniref:acetyl-CoA acetyltransferase n=1 Tax=Mycobacterium sp. TaxID=1785 RepID=UPI001EC53311
MTPVIVGVGQAAERIDDVGYRGLSPIDLAVAAARDAIADAGVDPRSLISMIDTVAATPQFENSSPRASAPLGKSTMFPLSVANRLGASPRRAVLEVSGGQYPQHLVTEFSHEIYSGSAEIVLLVGAEAMSTIRHLAQSEIKPDFSDTPSDPQGVYEDRGFGLRGLVSREQANHGLNGALAQYALLENARRAAKGMSRHEYAKAMGDMFAPFSAVAAANPYSAAPEQRSAEELVTVTDRNRLIADPYPRFVVARDQVNQGAAVLLTSQRKARELGIEQGKWVYLHGAANLQERDLFERKHFGEAPSAALAVRRALEIAKLTIDNVDFFDFYSCFPIAVFNAIDPLDLSPDDPRGLTLTGGLPFFGGAGNNYSMHAIAEAVSRVRCKLGSYALVSANGGVLSKTSVGVYSTVPSPLRLDCSEQLQADIDMASSPPRASRPRGWAEVETYTVTDGRNGKTGVVIGRLESGGGRFVARVASGDNELMDVLRHADEPIGQRFYVTALNSGNRATISGAKAAQLFSHRPAVLRDDYQFVSVNRDGHLLEVT